MPRALLLKKPKFNEEGDENNEETISGTKIPEIQTTTNEETPNKQIEDFHNAEIDCQITVADRFQLHPDSLASQNKCEVKQLKRRKKRIKGYKHRRKIKVEIKNISACSNKVIRKQRVAGPKRKKDTTTKLIKEDEVCVQDELETCTSQQHFVKWMKKDGKTFKVWECGICHKEFMHQYTLMRHLPTHTDERNFRCDICQKAFRQASTLCRHKAIHSDARPFPCIVCGKAFNRSSTLIAHRKTHSEFKPYICHVCGKGFHQKGNLKNHIYTHTGERPYKCDKCERGFNQMSNLMCHKAHAHVEKPKQTCHLCGKEFPHKFSLRSHEEYKHGIKYDLTGEHPLTVDTTKFKELMGQRSKLRQKSNRNCSKTITLPNGDKTIKFVNRILEHEMKSNLQKPSNEAPIEIEEVTHRIADEPLHEILLNSSEKNVSHANDVSPPSGDALPRTAGILIEPINTPAMITTMQNGQTPFALFRPAEGIPVLVKILPTTNGKQVVVPATAEDLNSAGKITVSPLLGQPNGATIKAVQIKVPVVATVSQKVSSNGELIIEIEAVDCLQDTHEEIIEQKLASLSEEQIPCGLEETVISLADARDVSAQNKLPLTNSGPKTLSDINTQVSSFNAPQNNNSLLITAGEGVERVHLSCADALATLSAAAVNIENQEVQTLPTLKADDNNDAVDVSKSLSTSTTEMIHDVIENIAELNTLTTN